MILYMLCGVPGAGKTTWANNFIKDNDIHYVSRDDIRFSIIKNDEDYFAHENEVFQKFVDTIYRTLVDGFDVVADATHLNKKSRAKLLRAIDRRGKVDFKIIFIYFNVLYKVCCERNAAREGRRCVPEDALLSMYHNLQEPQREEDRRCIGVWEVK